MRNIIILTFATLLVLANPAKTEAEEATALTREEVLAQTDYDIVIGDEDAKVTIVEYASLSCGHCATFHKDTLPFLKEKFINDGKAKLIFRHFPLNGQALKGSVLVECLDSSARKEKFVNTLFRSMDRWAYNKDYMQKLKTIAKVGGVKNEDFDKCMEDKSLEDRIANARLQASNVLKIQSTPTLFINGEMVKSRSNEELEKLINSKL